MHQEVYFEAKVVAQLQVPAGLQGVVDHFVPVEPLGLVLHLDRMVDGVVVKATEQVVRMPKVLGDDLANSNVVKILVASPLARLLVDVKKVLGDVPVPVDQVVQDVLDHEILVLDEP